MGRPDKVKSADAPSTALLFGAAVAVATAAITADIDPVAAIAGLRLGGFAPFLHGLIVAAACVGCAALAVLLQHLAFLRREVRRRTVAEQGAHGSARIDPLTGLPNRRALKERIDDALAKLWPGLGIAVLLIDLDGFKGVNDIYGHEIGDLVLCEAGERLRTALSFGTWLARLGGDEFAVLVPCSLRHQAVAEAEAIIVALAGDICVGDVTVNLGASIGIAYGPEDGNDTSSLLRTADIAMYRAKAAGRGRLKLFHGSMEKELRETEALKAALRSAIAAGQIVPFYQPVVDLRHGGIVEFEVLARWQHPTRGCLTPDRFIPLVESSGLATPLLVSLLRQVVRDVAAWPPHLRFAINVFPAQLLDPGLIEKMCLVIAAGGLLASRFCIEVTENTLVQDIARTRGVMDAAHAAGMTVALDDFGTGYSSLYHLRELPFDKLKIDRSFVQSMAADARNTAYIGAIIALCGSLSLEVTAEGIESADSARRLVEMGCQYGQGFLYAPPLPVEQAERLLAAEPQRLLVRPSVARRNVAQPSAY